MIDPALDRWQDNKFIGRQVELDARETARAKSDRPRVAQLASTGHRAAGVFEDVELLQFPGKLNAGLLVDPFSDVPEQTDQKIIFDVRGVGERKVEIFGKTVGLEIAFLEAGSALEYPVPGESRLLKDPGENPEPNPACSLSQRPEATGRGYQPYRGFHGDRSCGHCQKPAFRNEQAPASHQPAARKCGIEPRITLRQTLPACVEKDTASGPPFCQETQALEYGTIADPISVGHQPLIVPVAATEIGRQAVVDMLDTSPEPGIVQNVDNGAVNVRYGDPGPAAPDIPGSEHRARPEMPQDETGNMMFPACYTHRPLRHHYDIAEDLFRQTPVFRRSSSADVGGVVQRRHQHPWIVQYLLADQGVEAGRSISSRAYTA